MNEIVNKLLIPSTLGVLGGLAGLVVSFIHVFLAILISGAVGGYPALPFSILISLSFIGSFLGTIGGAVSSTNRRGGGSLLLAGALTVITGLLIAAGGFAGPGYGSDGLRVVLYFVSFFLWWIGLMLFAGLISFAGRIEKQSA